MSCQCLTLPSSTSWATAFIAEPLGMNSPQRTFTPLHKPCNMKFLQLTLNALNYIPQHKYFTKNINYLVNSCGKITFGSKCSPSTRAWSEIVCICYMRLVRGAVLSPTLIGSALTHSCSEVNAVDFVHQTCRGSTNYLKMPTLLCFIKSPLTVVMSCTSFYRHFRRLHRTIVCVIELINSACRTTQDALWIVTFLLGPCLRTFIN